MTTPETLLTISSTDTSSRLTNKSTSKMSGIEATVALPAFTPAPWTCIATKDSPARNGKNLKPSRLGNGILARPPHTRRARVSHHQISSDPFGFTAEPSTLKPTRVIKTPRKSPKSNDQVVTPNAFPEDLPDEVVRELLEQDNRTKKAEDTAAQDNFLMHQVVSDDALLSVSESKTETVGKPDLSDESTAQSNRRKEKAQQANLTEQLDKRQLENLAKKVKTRRTKSKSQKRRRTQPRSRRPQSNTWKDSFQAYMNEISREDLLDHAEIITLANRIKASVSIESERQLLQDTFGYRPTVPELAERLSIEPREVQRRLMAGTAAKNRLVSANLRLVTSVAWKVALGKSATKAGLALDDMIQEGSVGLIRAAEKFDATRGYKFSTYATWWVRAYVMRSISTQSRSIKVPSTIVDEYARIKKEYTKLRENGNFKPRDCQVARALGITPAKLRFVISVVTRVPTSLDISLHSPGDSSNSRSLGEIVEGQDRVEERMVEQLARKELDLALRDCLKPVERAVIKLRFGLEDGQSRTLRETGAMLGLSKERIRQIIFRALPKMKTPEIQRMLTELA